MKAKQVYNNLLYPFFHFTLEESLAAIHGARQQFVHISLNDLESGKHVEDG